MPQPFLVGSKVYLRPLAREDAPGFLEWINDVEVWSNLLTYRPMTLPQEEEFIADAGGDDAAIKLAIAVRESDQLVGAAGLDQIDWKNRHARFGIMIGDKNEWGKGYGTEAARLLVGYAFEILNLHRVWLHVYEYNERGRRAYVRAGFVQEGILREAHFHGGRYWDAIAMAVLRPQWIKDQPAKTGL